MLLSVISSTKYWFIVLHKHDFARLFLFSTKKSCTKHDCIFSTISNPGLNFEDFLKFFLCSDIIFLTYLYGRTHLIVQKNVEIITKIFEYSWFFRLFRGFSHKTFLYSELQFRAMYSSVHKSFLPKTVRISDFTAVKIV